jgi:CREB-regulated transcription coactivator 1
MASPRKFSEKIAQHVQRQAENTAAFEQIMSDVTRAKVSSAAFQLTIKFNDLLESCLSAG